MWFCCSGGYQKLSMCIQAATKRYCFLPIISCLTLRVQSLQPSTTRPSCWSKSILHGAVAVEGLVRGAIAGAVGRRFLSNVRDGSGCGASYEPVFDGAYVSNYLVCTNSWESTINVATPKCGARHVTELLGYDMRPVAESTGLVPILRRHLQPWFKYVSLP